MFQKTSGSEKIYGYEGGGSIKISFENFLSHSAEKCRRGTLWFFTKLGHRKNLDERCGGGDFQDFPSKVFCLLVPKNFVGRHFSESLVSGIEKFYASEVKSRLSVEKFFLTVPKHFVGERFFAVFRKISGSQKVYG